MRKVLSTAAPGIRQVLYPHYLLLRLFCEKARVTVSSGGLSVPASLTFKGFNSISGTPSPEHLIQESEAGRLPAGVPEMTQPSHLTQPKCLPLQFFSRSL